MSVTPGPGRVPTTIGLTSFVEQVKIRACLEAVPRVAMAVSAPPIHAVPRLGGDIGGPPLWFLRDDLLGFGGGGNKVRGLEYLLAAALSTGADTLITGAGPQSNHIRATAAAAATAGFAMHAVCWGDEPASTTGNLLLTRRFGATIHFTGDADRASVDAGMDGVADEVVRAGGRPYVIARGGAAPLAVLGHVRAAVELADRISRPTSALPRPDLVVLAVGSGGTLAGWLLASRLFGYPWRVVGYTVSRPVREARARVVALAGDAAALLGVRARDASVEGLLDIRGGVIGGGYGIPSPDGQAAIRRVARRTGVVLDPTYTGKAFAGYAADAAAGRFDGTGSAVFIHTGGEPANFALADG